MTVSVPVSEAVRQVLCDKSPLAAYRVYRRNYKGCEAENPFWKLLKALEGLDSGGRDHLANTFTHLLLTWTKRPEMARQLGMSSNWVGVRLRELRSQGLVLSTAEVERRQATLFQKLISDGRTAAEIGKRMCMTPQQVETRTNYLRRKRMLDTSMSRHVDYETFFAEHRSLLETGSRREIAEALRITQSAVKARINRLRKLGYLPEPSTYQVRTDENLKDHIIEMRAAGIPRAEICQQLSITDKQFDYRIRILKQDRGLETKVNPKVEHLKEMAVTFAHLRSEGTNTATIAEMLGMTFSQADYRIRKMVSLGLIPPVRGSIKFATTEGLSRYIDKHLAAGFSVGEIAGFSGIAESKLKKAVELLHEQGLISREKPCEIHDLELSAPAPHDGWNPSPQQILRYTAEIREGWDHTHLRQVEVWDSSGNI